MPAITKNERVEDLNLLSVRLNKDRVFEEQKPYPVKSNWASQMGDPCERKLYYLRHDWEKANTRKWGGVGQLGNLIHDWWKIHMMKKGYELTQHETPLNDELIQKYQLGGRIDGRIGWNKIKPILYEFKTMSPWVYDKINSYDDFSNAKSDYLRGYPAQIQLYLLSCNEEAGMFVLCNKLNLDWKIIPVYLDMGYCEWLLQRADRVNKANVAGAPPNRIFYCKTCIDCQFSHICLPDIINEGIEMQDNEHLEMLINTMEENREAVKIFNDTKDEADEIAKTVGKDFIVGSDWMVNIKKRTGTRLDKKLIPIEELTKYEVPSETVTVKYVPISKAKIK